MMKQKPETGDERIQRLLERVQENRRRYLATPASERVVSVSVPIGGVVGFEILGYDAEKGEDTEHRTSFETDREMAP